MWTTKILQKPFSVSFIVLSREYRSKCPMYQQETTMHALCNVLAERVSYALPGHR